MAVRVIIAAVIGAPPQPDGRGVRHGIYNIGHGEPVRLLDFVDALERILLEEGAITEPAVREHLPMQPGDVHRTHASTAAFERDFGFAPRTTLEDGLRSFARWYAGYRGPA